MKAYSILFFLLISIFLEKNIGAQGIVINEFCSSNSKLISDEDGDFSDWIELLNTGESEINLANFGISDDSLYLQKWTFPEIILKPKEYLLVWASGKNRKPTIGKWQQGILREVYTNFTGSSVNDLFNHPNFPNNPTTRDTIKTLFEAPQNSADYYGQRMSAYILAPITGKYTFWISGNLQTQLYLSTDDNPANIVKIAETTGFTDIRQWDKYPSQKSIEITLEAGKYYFISALMIETTGSDHLAVLWQLPNGRFEEPIPASRLSVLKKPMLHSNFKIASEGERLFLTDNTGKLINETVSFKSDFNQSFGRLPNGMGDWKVFLQPTPGTENNDKVFQGRCEPIVFSQNEGFYTGSVSVSLSCTTPGSTIYYTTNGSVPTISSAKYLSPIVLNTTKTVRAQAFSDNLSESKIGTKTYLINENTTFPVVSVTTDPLNLYDTAIGIFVGGNPYQTSNLFQDWERPANLQFFDSNKNLGFNLDVGIKVHGGLTRGSAQKSLAIYARSEYGSPRIDYKMFAQKNIESFNNLVLRNAGNDFQWTKFRDCFMTTLVKDLDLELQAYRPSVIFLNGQYWGITNIREKMGEHFIEDNTGVPEDKLDICEYAHTSDTVLTVHGSVNDFNGLIDYVKANELSNDASYSYVETEIDISNYIDYNVAQIYFDNSDWPGNNNKWWRPKENGKWRWLMFDTDFGYSLSPFKNEVGDGLLHYKHNTLKIATAVNGESWPNPPHSTFLFNSLLKNNIFRNRFINRFCDQLNSTFLPFNAKSLLSKFKSTYLPEIARHRSKFSGSPTTWEYDVSVMFDFAEFRPKFMFEHLRDEFSLQPLAKITLEVSDTTKGTLKINTIQCDKNPWSGDYFIDIPVTITALPKSGFRFVKWSDGNTSISRNINVGTTSQLTAVFETAVFNPSSIVINEINYVSSEEKNCEDWIELYNNSDATADVSGWMINDSNIDNGFVFPNNTFIQPYQYLVIAKSSRSVSKYHPNISNLIGDMDFGLSSVGDHILLYDSKMNLVDSLTYNAFLPWPDLVSSPWLTIELKNPNLDNLIASNWILSQTNGGTPGQQNSKIPNSIVTVSEQNYPNSYNYPNPFKHSTRINYTVASNAHVKIDILNISGQIISTLVNCRQLSGKYSCEWEGTSLSGTRLKTGIYLYRISVNGVMETKRMVLMN